jgi:CheY-like chemotaxis protein
MNINNKKHTYDSVLLIDDNVLDNFINEKMVEINSFAKKVYISTSGTSALEFINNLAILEKSGDELYPSIIFIDLNMPNMDGFAFIENFKKINIKNIKKPKIVILTSSVNIEDKIRAEGIESGVTFVNKPLTKAILDTL